MPVLMPENLLAACDLMAEYEEAAIPFAGGTDLMVHWPERLDQHEKTFLDLSKLSELKTLKWTADELILGSLITYWDVVRDAQVHAELPLLVTAARQVGSIQIQTRGTWAGNIANASPAADGVPVLMAYDAVVDLVSRDGSEQWPLDAFYLGYKKTRRRPDQLIRAIRIPRRAYEVEWFEKVGSRAAQAITKVGVAVTRSAAGWRVVANSMAPCVCRCPALESLLNDGKEIRSPDDLLPAIRADVSPIDDLRSTSIYRERVMARVLYHELRPIHPAFR